MPAIFISHSSRDRKAADDVKAVLAQFGLERVFLDFDKDTGFGAGEDWERRLYEEIARCHAVVLILTDAWLESKWCFAELTQARAQGKLILPIVCEPLSGQNILPNIQAIDLLDWNSDGLARLQQRLGAMSDELARGFKLDPKRTPYPGIRAFEAEDAAIYFGRDEETHAVIERLEARRTQGGARVILIIGASGAGKSSLMKAGVLPQLARRRNDWLILPTMRPEKAPLVPLAKAIAHQRGAPDAWEIWLEKLRSADAADSIAKLVAELRIGDARAAAVLLPIDQFEEAFTVAGTADREAFLHLLADALDPSNGLPLMVVATGRSDVLDGLIETGALAHIYETVPLVPMPLDRVPRLVEGPAEVVGLNVEKGLAERVRRDVESSEALPLLAQALALLYRRSVADKKLTIAKYDALGDRERGFNPIQNSVHLAADQAIEGMRPLPTEAEMGALRDAFVSQLVHVRLDDGKRLRQPASLSKLPSQSMRLIHALVEARLLTTRERQIEVAHEALFQAWPILDQWLTEEHSFLIDLERLRGAYDVFSQAPAETKSGALLHGLLLSRGREWLLRYPQRFDGLEALRTFIAESAAAADAEAAKVQERRRVMFAGSITAAILLAIVAVMAAWQWRVAVLQRQEAQTLRLTAVWKVLAFEGPRQKERTGDDDLAGLLARQAFLVHERLKAQPTGLVDYSLDAVRPKDSFRHVLRGHFAAVLSVAFSQDGRLVSGSWDRTIRAWDLRRPEAAPQILAELTGGVRSVAFSRDWQRLVSGGDDGTVYVWDLGQTRSEARKIAALEGSIWSVAISPDGQTVAAGNDNGTIHILDLHQPQATAIELAERVKHVHSVAFSPDGKTLVSGNDDGTAYVWDLGDLRNPRRVLRGKGRQQINAVAFSPTGNRMATGSEDGSITIWNLQSFSTVPRELSNPTPRVLALAFSPDGGSLVSGGGDSTVRIWSLRPPHSEPLELPVASQGDIRSVAFSPDGRWLVSGSEDTAIRIWDLRQARQEALAEGGPVVQSAPQPAVFSVAFGPDGQTLYGGSTDGRVHVWDLRKRPIGALTFLSDHGAVRSVAFSRSGQWLAAGTADGTTLVWNARNPDATRLALTGNGEIWSVAFAPDGQKLASASADGTVRIWGLNRSRDPPTVLGHAAVPSAEHTCFTPMEISKRQADVYSVAFSPDGHLLASGHADGKVRVWNLRQADAPPLELAGHQDYVCAVAFSPDGRLLASASGDNSIRLWNLGMPGSPATVLGGHSDDVLTIAFSPDGRRLASGSADGTIRIWDPHQLNSVPVVVKAGPGKVLSIAFSPDGRELASASQTGSVRVWYQSAALADFECELVWRNLSMQEWRLFIGEGIPYERTCPNLPSGPWAPTSAPMVDQSPAT